MGELDATTYLDDKGEDAFYPAVHAAYDAIAKAREIADHTEQDCRHLIDAQVAKGLELEDFPDLSNASLLASVERVLEKRNRR